MEKNKRIESEKITKCPFTTPRLIVWKFNMEKHKRIESETTNCPSTTPRLIVCKFKPFDFYANQFWNQTF